MLCDCLPLLCHQPPFLNPFLYQQSQQTSQSLWSIPLSIFPDRPHDTPLPDCGNVKIATHTIPMSRCLPDEHALLANLLPLASYYLQNNQSYYTYHILKASAVEEEKGVLIIIFPTAGCYSVFSGSRRSTRPFRCQIYSTRETIERYQRHTKDNQSDNPPDEQHMQQLKHETAGLKKKIELLEISKRRLLGESLESCTIQDLQQLEQQLERSVGIIRARKMQVFKQQIDELKEKGKALAAENAMLCEKYGVETQQGSSNEERAVVACTEISEVSDVETELFIGPPEVRYKRNSLPH